MSFEEWLRNIYVKNNGESIAEVSVKKYSGAVNTISDDMKKIGVIDKCITDMDLDELDKYIPIILENKGFKTKDKTGNNMYSCGLKRYRCYRFYTDEENIINKELSTEKVITTKARTMQGTFRKKILEKYEQKCIINNISIVTTLVASHIKPWRVSNNDERIDVNNGLLLSATYDRLFDGGLITFSKDGKVHISNIVNEENRKILHLKENDIFNIKYDGKMDEYLKYHNEYIFVK